ncbi:MAG: hypothetical protein DRI73_04025, partial [Bacteroidetes bacterium]
MLKSGVIPKEEPLLKVGIVLPEDNQQSVDLVLKDVESTLLVINDQFSVPVAITDHKIEVAIVEDTLRIKSYNISETIRNIKLI